MARNIETQRQARNIGTKVMARNIGTQRYDQIHWNSKTWQETWEPKDIIRYIGTQRHSQVQ